jgi:hypothetical protein
MALLKTISVMGAGAVLKTVFDVFRQAAGAQNMFLGTKVGSRTMLAWKLAMGTMPERFVGAPKSTRVENTALIAAVEGAMINPLCALHCLYAPPDFGKSRAIAEAARALLAKDRLRGCFDVFGSCRTYTCSFCQIIKIYCYFFPPSGVFSITADNEVREGNLTNWLKKKLGVPEKVACDLVDLLPACEDDKHYPGIRTKKKKLQQLVNYS